MERNVKSFAFLKHPPISVHMRKFPPEPSASFLSVMLKEVEAR